MPTSIYYLPTFFTRLLEATCKKLWFFLRCSAIPSSSALFDESSGVKLRSVSKELKGMEHIKYGDEEDARISSVNVSTTKSAALCKQETKIVVIL